MHIILFVVVVLFLGGVVLWFWHLHALTGRVHSQVKSACGGNPKSKDRPYLTSIAHYYVNHPFFFCQQHTKNYSFNLTCQVNFKVPQNESAYSDFLNSALLPCPPITSACTKNMGGTMYPFPNCSRRVLYQRLPLCIDLGLPACIENCSEFCNLVA